MRKTLFIAFAFISTIALRANAQITVAPEIGVHSSLLTSSLQPTSVVGFKIGGVVDVPIIAGLHFQPGLFFLTKGSETNADILDLGTVVVTNKRSSIKLNTLEVSLNLVYNFNFKNGGALFGFAGPYLGYNLSGKEKYTFKVADKVTAEGTNTKLIGSEANQLKAFDYGMNVGLGYKLPMGLYFRAQYSLGLANLSNVKNTDVKSTYLGVSVGYFLGRK
ncbi:MAG: porin family protein [Taibaiella sp.]|jgi:hypothetical protein